MQVVLFDLDNTLYPEAEFVKSGFRAVANFLHAGFDVDPTAVTAQMEARVDDRGREKVFDWLVDHLELAVDPRTLVHVYRTHTPQLAPFPDAIEGLTELRRRGIRTGLVSDGTSSVQRGKVAALGLYDSMAAVVVTDELGPDAGKPSELGFRVALELLRVRTGDAAYVGDDASKDFRGPNGLGMRTVQVKREHRWPFDRPAPGPEFEPDLLATDVVDAIRQLFAYRGER